MEPANAHDFDAERAVLAAIIRGDPGTFFAVRDIVAPADFFDPAAGAIFATIDELVREGCPIDLALISARLREAGKAEFVGGDRGLADSTIVFLLDALPEPSSARYYAQVIRGHADRRRAHAGLLAAAKSLGTEPTDAVLAGVARLQDDLGSQRTRSQVIHVAEAAAQAVQAYAEPAAAYLSTGYAHLDQAIHGFAPGEFAVIAGPPFSGKTRFVANLLPKMASVNPDCPVLLCSMEEEPRSIGETVLTAGMQFSRPDLRQRAKTDLDRLLAQIHHGLDDVPFFIHRRHRVTSDSATALIRQAKARHGARVVAFDNLHLMEDGAPRRRGDRVQEIANITRALKVAAVETDTIVIALSHLNREAMKRDDHRPKLSDLRDSGAIEQDADLVAFLYREDYFKTPEPGAPPLVCAPVDLIVRKRRGGQPTTVPFLFFSADCSFRPRTTDHDGGGQR